MAKKILIIEDDRLLLKALENSFLLFGFDVFTATNGKDALIKFTDHDIDLVICDIMMPEVSGISFINEIKKNYNAEIPVIIISSLRSGEQITTSLDYKNSIYLPKPFSFEKITDIVRDLLRS